jgi:hypothetical protein
MALQASSCIIIEYARGPKIDIIIKFTSSYNLIMK